SLWSARLPYTTLFRSRRAVALEVLGMAQRGGDDAGGQAKGRVLRGREGLVVVTHLEHAHYRPEDLLAVDAHVRRDLGEQRRRERSEEHTSELQSRENL